MPWQNKWLLHVKDSFWILIQNLPNYITPKKSLVQKTTMIFVAPRLRGGWYHYPLGGLQEDAVRARRWPPRAHPRDPRISLAPWTRRRNGLVTLRPADLEWASLGDFSVLATDWASLACDPNGPLYIWCHIEFQCSIALMAAERFSKTISALLKRSTGSLPNQQLTDICK